MIGATISMAMDVISLNTFCGFERHGQRGPGGGGGYMMTVINVIGSVGNSKFQLKFSEKFIIFGYILSLTY